MIRFKNKIPIRRSYVKFFFAISLLLIIECYFIRFVFALDSKKAVTQYVHDVWQDELPQNTILSITQTRDGYLWLGTYEGLVRFDGIRFTVFNRMNTPEIKSNAIYSLYEDRSGTLWIGTNSGGLNCLRQGKFYNYTIGDGLLSNNVRTVREDGSGSLWIGTDRGLNLYKDGRFSSVTTKDGLPNDFVRDILVDSKGALWIATDGGLCAYNNKKFIYYGENEGFTVKDIPSKLYEDREGNIYIGTNGSGLCVFSNGKFRNYSIKDGLSGRFVYPILQDKDGSIWIGSDGGGLMRMRDGKFASYMTKDGLTQDFVRSIYEDREGSLWIGINGGLNRLKDGKFTTFTIREGLTNDNIRAVLEAADGSLWIGTDAGGVCRYKDGLFSSLTVKDGLPTDGIRSLYEDRDGVLWIGTNNGGLCRYKDGKLKTYTTKDGLSGDAVYALAGDREGNLWIGITLNRLCRFKDEKFTIYGPQDGLPDNSIRAIYEDRAGSVWFGSSGGGLIRRQDDGKFVVHSTKDGLSSDIIFCIYEDREANLWIGTNNGLNRFKNGKFRSYTTKDGLHDDTVFQILEDGSGNLWMSSNKGIFKVDKKDLDRFDEGAIKKIASSAYGKADGMGANQCNGSSQPAGCRTRDGRLWFPTIKGLTMIDTEKIRLNELPPPVVIEQMTVDGMTTESAVLGPGGENFEFQYSALSLLVPQKVKFKYKLEGFDEDWNDVGLRRTAYYTHIPPGSYTFKVIACNNDGVWNDTGASLAFTLKPPLWRTWWAYLLYASFSTAFCYSGIRLRFRYLKRRNEELEAKVAERTAALVKKNEELDEAHKKTEAIFSALTEALPGTVIDEKYRLDDKIGTGGFGAVYRAMHLIMKRQVAVKIFRPPSGNRTPDNLKRFLLEAVSSSRLNHPNVVTVLDSGVSKQGIAYLVMELLQGRTLSNELHENAQLSPERCAEILLPICDVLNEAHKAGIIHRDIKPDNIFLHQTENGEVIKVVDFGIAKLIGDTTNPDFQSITAPGAFLGTPVYMAPEQFDNRSSGGKADIYSLGVTVYQMLCGRVPFEFGPSGVYGLINMHLSKEPPPIREINPNIPAEVEQIVMRTLAKDPKKRPTAAELAKEFADVVNIEWIPRAANTAKFATNEREVSVSDSPTEAFSPKTAASGASIDQTADNSAPADQTLDYKETR